MVRVVPVALLCLLLTSLAWTQAKAPAAAEAEETETLKIDVDLVSIMFSVQDKKGALIPGMTKEDFTVLEDGKPQTIKYFTRETDLPLTIGLLVDVSRSQENLIQVERHAASQFFTKVLRNKDMAFLMSFGSEAELLQDSTNSPKLLRKGLDDLRVNSAVVGLHPGPVPTASRARGTIMFDAVYLAANEKLRSEVGRKAIVIITDGVDQGSRKSITEAIAEAHRADTIIYAIQYVDNEFYFQNNGGFGVSDGDLKRMAEETGGRMFRVSGKQTLDDIFTQIQEEIRTQYLVGYTPTNTARDGAFRKVEIKTARKDTKVRARKGYFAGS